MDKQMDEATRYDQILRTNAQKVGEDILCYHQSLDETNAFLAMIENHSFAFLHLVRKVIEEKD